MAKLKAINKIKNIVPYTVELIESINLSPIIEPRVKCRHKVIVRAITIDEE